MTAHMPPPLRLACHGFSINDIEALRSLLGLLQRYLKRPWQVAPRVDSASDIVLINLDQPDRPDLPGHVRQIGCALKPRQQAAGCIHRPLRAAEILALLSEHGRDDTEGSTQQDSDPSQTFRYRLHAWPLALHDWSRPAWRIMAALSHQSLDTQELVHRTGIARNDIDDILHRLAALQLLTQNQQRAPHAEVASSDTPWRAMAGRIGKLLGMAR